jgi:hypothetical protein
MGQENHTAKLQKLKGKDARRRLRRLWFGSLIALNRRAALDCPKLA